MVKDNAFPPTLPRGGGYWLQTLLWLQQCHLLLKEGVLYRQWKDVPGKGQNKYCTSSWWYQSPPFRELHNAHAGSHVGLKRTFERIHSCFYWSGQQHDVENWCKACEKCASLKSPSRAPMQSDLVGHPLQHISWIH